jgi:hypothetical protein
VDTDVVPAQPRERRRPGPVGRLARLAAKTAWERIAPGVDPASLHDAFEHQAGEGFLEPTAGRYLIDDGGYAQLRADGKRFGGLSGAPLQPRHQQRRAREQRYDPLGLLTLLGEVTDARRAGDEAVRGTMCRKIAARAGSVELTVWIDDEHVRRIQTEEHASSTYPSITRRWTLELWDFGVPTDSLDRSRLPSFRTPDGP